MIPLIEREVAERKRWVDKEKLADILALSQTVPGAIAINAATFIGMAVGGRTAALVATLGVILPSFIVITLIAAFFGSFSENRYVRMALAGIQPAVAALIAVAAWRVGRTSIRTERPAHRGRRCDAGGFVGVSPIWVILGAAWWDPRCTALVGGAAVRSAERRNPNRDYWELLVSFFRIGLFSFGGGYAMLSLIQSEIERHGWMTASQFVDIIAIAEMTPGPVAVNTATFVGYRMAGLAGGAVATMGLALPSMIIILILSGLYIRFQKKPLARSLFAGVRPAVTGLIVPAGVFVARAALLREDGMGGFREVLADPSRFVNPVGAVILILSLAVLIRWKAHPILVVVGAAAAGVVIYSLFPSLLPG
jgi:chromate transporter